MGLKTKPILFDNQLLILVEQVVNPVVELAQPQLSVSYKLLVGDKNTAKFSNEVL